MWIFSVPVMLACAALYFVSTKIWVIILLTRAKSDHLSSGAISNDEDDDDEAEDYTVYECPGLAPVSFCTTL